MKSRNFLVLLHWPNYGPYHLARFQACFELLVTNGIGLIGLEIACREASYLWGEISEKSIQIQTLFSRSTFEEIGAGQKIIRLLKFLDLKKPDVLAINGYSGLDSWTLLGWCKKNKRKAILMSDSRENDFPRFFFKEQFKKFLVSGYASAICGGVSHQEYLLKLGMSADRIYTGYDVVDNNYFQIQSNAARSSFAIIGNLPGLDKLSPYFLASARLLFRKNIHGLLAAYELYSRQMIFEGLTPWRLVILGDGIEKPRILEIIRERKIDGVTLAGQQPYVVLPKYYAHAKAFIHTALQDQWGLVVNEAMASGLPVLVSRQSGCASELVEDGVNGYQFDAGDIPGLAQWMVRFSREEFDLLQMGRESQRIIANWGPDRFAASFLSAVKAVI